MNKTLEINSSIPSCNITNLSPQEEALKSLCKQLLKSRLFRGSYLERRFVESVSGYRDIISLHRSELPLEKLLLDICQKLQMFYFHSATPNIWIGVSNGSLIGIDNDSSALQTYLWVELDDVPFGNYWFSVKSVRFRDNEILLKLKLVRDVENDCLYTPHKVPSFNTPQSQIALSKTTNSLVTSQPPIEATPSLSQQQIDVKLQDFIDIFQQWGTSTKLILYNFLSHDINKHNIKELLRFLGLLIVSLLSGMIAAVKFLGVFTIRLLFELTRLTHVLTPIILKIIEVFNKIIGGFYILLAMVWRDIVGNRGNKIIQQENSHFRAIEYNRPLYKSIQFDIKQRKNTKI